MFWIPVLYISLIVVLAIAVAIKARGSRGSPVGFPYRSSKPLFSATERSFLGMLDLAAGPEHRVFGKVRVADIVVVWPGLDKSARQGALDRVAFKHFDFVVCHARDLSVLCAIELNDMSHNTERAQERDRLLTGVCQAIDLPLLHVPAQRSYSIADLREQLLTTIGASDTPESAGSIPI